MYDYLGWVLKHMQDNMWRSEGFAMGEMEWAGYMGQKAVMPVRRAGDVVGWRAGWGHRLLE